ncbi:hypothetical protein ACQ4PT_055449 [Festuca glaucescens]
MAAGGKFGVGPRHGRVNVWQRDVQEGSGQNSSNGGSGQHGHEDRWEAATQGTQGNQASNTQGTNRVQNQQPPRAPRNDGREDPGPCVNCNTSGHLVAHCPTLRCARCGKLGHISHICQVLLPWQCIASMCGFQSPGQGFFYFPDSSTPQQVKEKASTVIISVVEGNMVARDIEKEFNEGGFFGQGWRCTTRTLSPIQFSMRFPSAKEVERACCWGNEFKMKTKNAILKLSPWSDDVGASAKLQKAWVQVRNIPSEKRNEAHAAFAGSLVGVTLDIDKSTLMRPEYVRILLGCRDVEEIPRKAEGCLGDNFYIFYYELDKVMVGRQPKNNTMIPVDSSSGLPSPKRARTENASTYESSVGQSEGQQLSGSTSYGKTHTHTLEPVSEHESEEESEEDTGLLIEEIIHDKNSESLITNMEGGEKSIDESLDTILEKPADASVVHAGEEMQDKNDGLSTEKAIVVHARSQLSP